MQSAPGTSILSAGALLAGKWRVESLLGSGGMATVYLARAADGRRVAVKLLHRDLNDIAEVKQRFLREGPIGSALANIPGVVNVLESGETEDGTAYLAMEALEGETLSERLGREGTFPAADVLSIAQQVLDVLVQAHDRGVIHRDLKPENLHLGADGRVRILDFGIARVVDAIQKPLGEADTEAAPVSNLPEKAYTKTGVIMGTAAYMAPEQATGLVNEIDARTDLFSVGATMFRLLAGRTLHAVQGEAAELILAATEPAPPLSTVAFGVPPDLAAVVDRSLAFIKHHRYPDTVTMREDVRALRAGRPPPYVRAIADGRIPAGAPMPAEAVDPPASFVPPGAFPPPKRAAGELPAVRAPVVGPTVVGLGPAAGQPAPPLGPPPAPPPPAPPSSAAMAPMQAPMSAPAPQAMAASGAAHGMPMHPAGASSGMPASGAHSMPVHSGSMPHSMPLNAAGPQSMPVGSVAGQNVPVSAGVPPSAAVPSSGVKPPSSVGPTLVDSPHQPATTVSESPPAATATPGKKSKRKLVVAIVVVAATAIGVAIGVGIAVTRCDSSKDTASAAASASAAPSGRVPSVDGGFRIRPRPKR